jgi:hypothetical protein
MVKRKIIAKVIVSIIVLIISLAVVYSLIDRNISIGPGSAMQEASNTLDTDKNITLRNKASKVADVSLTVVNKTTGQTVFTRNYTIEPNSQSRGIYNLRKLNITSIQEYRIRSTYNRKSENVSVVTNQCYGNTIIEITERNSLNMFYAIC